MLEAELGSSDAVGAVAFSPTGARVASAYPRDLRIWNLPRGDVIVGGNQESMLGVVWLDEHSVACAGRDVDSGPPVYVFEV